MSPTELQEQLYAFLRPAYPDMDIQVLDTPDNVRQLYFTDARFKTLYPKQRYHLVSQLIPDDFFEQHLLMAECHELAPGETPEDLHYPDDDTIEAMAASTLDALKEKTGFATLLDHAFTQNNVQCQGDFRQAKALLTQLQFTEAEQLNILHVLMHEGGYCDCEILYNVFPETAHSKKYWLNREDEAAFMYGTHG
jgi:hypothetical protein